MSSRVLRVALVSLLATAGIAFGSQFSEPVRWDKGLKPNTRVGRDAQGRIVAIALPDGRIVRSAYDAKHNFLAQQATNGEVIRYRRGKKDRMEARIERGIETEFLFDSTGSIMATLAGSSPADRQRAARELGLQGWNGDRPRAAIGYDDLGRAISTTVAGVAVNYHYGPGASDLRQVLKTKEWSYSIGRRALANGGLEVSDSFGNALVLYRGKTQSAITNAEGRLIATCDYDANGRPVRLTASGLVIEYVYGGDGEWSEKIIRHVDGAELRRFPRVDYPDPALGLQARGELRAATGDVVAQLDASGVTYTINSAIAPRVSRAGELLYFSFSFPSQTRYADDEIRLMADGSIKLYPSLPHAEMTSASRRVQPVELSLPTSWRGAAIAAAPVKTTPSTLAAPAKPALKRPMRTAAEWYWTYQSCSYVPGGSTIIDGVENLVADGYWSCNTFWAWFPDPAPYYPPLSGGGGLPAQTDPNNTPLSADQQQRVDEGKALADDRLCNLPACAQLFAQFDKDGRNIIGSTTYLNGRPTTTCQEHLDWGMWTNVNSNTVYLCNAFDTASEGGSATLLIHEALHSAGLNEYPGDPNGMTSAQINDMVQAACNLTW